jgi:hypothetical protein
VVTSPLADSSGPYLFSRARVVVDEHKLSPRGEGVASCRASPTSLPDKRGRFADVVEGDRAPTCLLESAASCTMRKPFRFGAGDATVGLSRAGRGNRPVGINRWSPTGDGVLGGYHRDWPVRQAASA